MKNTGREPMFLKDGTDPLTANSHPDFMEEKFQYDYNNMIKSIDKYGGFYVGRYEMSLNYPSKKGETSASSSRSSGSSWYGLYYSIEHSNLSNEVVSNMMWLSQWIALNDWINNNAEGNTIRGLSPNTGYVNGDSESDKINNIYDLRGNRKGEWTLGGYNYIKRMYISEGIDINMSEPETYDDNIGTRVTLYIRDDMTEIWTGRYATLGEDCTGYYADVDGNGTVDGIIYADLAFSKEGQWIDSSGKYKYDKVTDKLKSYKIGKKQKVEKFNNYEKEVVTPVKGTTGKDRFYVMALEDVDQKVYGWYEHASGLDNLDSSDIYFGTNKPVGKENTEKMIDKWNSGSYGTKGDNDLWGMIQDKKINTKYDISIWFVPSKVEWAAFNDMLYTCNYLPEKVTKEKDNFTKYGLSFVYWTSSQAGHGSLVYGIHFKNGYIFSGAVWDDAFASVRLSTTY